MIKHTTKMFAVLFVFTSIIMFNGCQDEQSVITPENSFASLSKETNLVIPDGATVASAHLKIFQLIGNNTQNNIHRVTSPWDESTVTGNNFGGYDPAVINFFNTSSSFDDNWNSVDITSLVVGWLNGNISNDGLLIDQLSTGTGPEDRSVFYSKENTNPTLGERMPYLEIVFSNGDSVELGTNGDAYITEGTDVNTGNSLSLNTGYFNSKEKHALIKFDIEPTPQDGGCTLTSGYWKTHTEFGPEPYNDTWAHLSNGATTTFFLSGKSYHQVLWTSALGGNAYYILAHAYIAAQLNFLNGADPTEAQTAFDNATTLFNTYTPLQISRLRGNSTIRNQFIYLSIQLGKYNIGLIGPGHCHL